MVCHNGVRTSVDWAACCWQLHVGKMGPKYREHVLKIKITKKSRSSKVVGHVVSQLAQVFNITMDGLHCHGIARSILSLFFGRQLPPSQPEVGPCGAPTIPFRVQTFGQILGDVR